MTNPMFGTPPEDETPEDEIDLGGFDEMDSKFCVPDGDWVLRVLSAERTVSKSSGNPMVVLDTATTGEWVGESGELETHPEADGHSGKEFKVYLSFSPQALFKMKQVADALDIPITSGRIRCKLSAFAGKQLLAEMETSEYEGRNSSKPGNIKRHPQGPSL